MFNYFEIQKSIQERLKKFFSAKGAEYMRDPGKLRLIFKIENDKLLAELYECNTFVNALTLKSIAETFGKEFDENRIVGVKDFLERTAISSKVERDAMNVIIRE